MRSKLDCTEHGEGTLRHHLGNDPKGLALLPRKARQCISTRAEEENDQQRGAVHNEATVHSFAGVDSDGILCPHRILHLVAVQASQ